LKINIVILMNSSGNDLEENEFIEGGIKIKTMNYKKNIKKFQVYLDDLRERVRIHKTIC
jgi:hypothetical protein